jgi:hypothetical protein
MRLALIAVLALGWATCASAHDKLADGSPVPEWIRKSCCGPADFHELTADQVHLRADGCHVDGYPYVIPVEKAEPSGDSRYYIFYNKGAYGDGTEYVTQPFCFLIPPSGS